MAAPSKNSRSSRSSSQNRPVAVGLFRFLIPVGAGTSAYVFDPETGTNPRLSTTSAEFVDTIAALSGKGHGAKLAEELRQLAETHPDHGWEATAARLRDAGAL